MELCKIWVIYFYVSDRVSMQYVNNLKYTFHTHSRQLLGVFCEKQPQDNNFTYSIECGSMNWDGRVKCYSSLCISLRNCSCTAVRCVVLTLIPPCSYLSRCIVTRMYTWRKCWLSLFCYNVPRTLLGSPIRQTYEVWDALKSDLWAVSALCLLSLWVKLDSKNLAHTLGLNIFDICCGRT